MRTWKSLLLILSVAVVAWAPATASAAFRHVVAHGESLSSVAAADGLSVGQLAAANGMSPDAQLVVGSSLVIPPQDAAAAEPAVSSAPSSSASPASAPAVSSGGDGYQVQPGDTLSAIAARLGVSVDSLAAANGLDPSGVLVSGTTLHGAGSAASGSGSGSSAPAASSGAGRYEVRPGDTLSAIAARFGVSIASLASANGMNAGDLLVSGRTIAVSGASAPASSTGSTEMVSTSPATGSGAQPTGETVSASEIGSIAGSEGVPPSLAEAIGYQESGFNNGKVSATGATGVMQIMPSTWSYIGQNLAGPPPLSPTSAADNIRAGSLLLHSLLNATGGDAAMAVAGYYQGLQSVRQHGLFSDTQAYVNNVMALRQRFGGG